MILFSQTFSTVALRPLGVERPGEARRALAGEVRRGQHLDVSREFVRIDRRPGNGGRVDHDGGRGLLAVVTRILSARRNTLEIKEISAQTSASVRLLRFMGRGFRGVLYVNSSFSDPSRCWKEDFFRRRLGVLPVVAGNERKRTWSAAPARRRARAPDATLRVLGADCP